MATTGLRVVKSRLDCLIDYVANPLKAATEYVIKTVVYKDLQRMRNLSDDFCKEYGLSVMENKKYNGRSRASYYQDKTLRAMTKKMWIRLYMLVIQIVSSIMN
ncbi:MAG: hypothetical protein E7189_09255 [Erysipelotrichaceae bacterium]|nr:hypothetical protein [Erysipelotrichaceae bacterium]